MQRKTTIVPRCLYIDDLRMPFHYYDAVVRSVPEAQAYIRNTGCPDFISFDYNLGNGQTIKPFIEWLIHTDKIKHGRLIPPHFDFESHTSSPDGEKWIIHTLNSYLKERSREE